MARVCAVVANSVSRDARVLREAAVLAAAGHQVIVVGIKEDGSESSEELIDSGVRVLRVDLSHPSRRDSVSAAWRMLGRNTRLFSCIARLNPDVLHCHDIYTLPVGAAAKWILRCAVIYDAHEIYEEIAQGTKATAFRYRLMHRCLLPMIDRFITINESIADWYTRRYRRLSPAVVVMNAVPKAQPFEYDGRLHRAAGLGKGAKILLYQGGYAPLRGLHHLVRAAEHLPPDWTLVMMGWGALEEQLRDLSGDICARVADRRSPPIRFIPPASQAELPLWTAGAALGVIPYENIGLNHWFCTPNKLWEYPNAGVPVLVSPFPELRKPVEKYGFGWLLPEDQDSCRLAALVADLSDADLARARLACRDFIEAENWTKYGSRVVALYQELLASRSRARSWAS